VSEWESVSEWLHGHPSRVILIKPAGHNGKDGEWVPRPDRCTFTLVTRLPDGRKVMSNVEILDEIMMEPAAGDMIVHNAKMAIGNLLRRGQEQDETGDGK
jgi:hypothetical protein